MMSKKWQQKGQKQFNAGLGFASSTIPIYVGLDFWVHQDISIGGEIGWRRWKIDEWKDHKYHYDIYNFLFNGNYHFSRILGIPEKFDIYAGLNVGFYYWTNNVDLGGQIGFRYFFNSKVGLGLEFNGGNQINSGKIGISIKF